VPFDWTYQIMLIPTYLLHGFALARLIRFGRPRLFWFLWLATHIGMNCLIRGGGSWLSFVSIVFLWVVVPFLLSDETPSKKLLACGLAFVVMMVAEVLVSLLWIAATGSNNTLDSAQANMAQYVLMRIFHLLALTALFLGANRLWSRRVKPVRDGTLLLFAAFPLTQAILLFYLLFIGAFLVADRGVYGWASALALVCVLADLVLFVVLRQMNEKQLADERSAFLQKQLEGQLAYYGRVVERIEETARFRHDLRNQLQTVYGLIDRDETEAARRQLDAIAENLYREENAI